MANIHPSQMDWEATKVDGVSSKDLLGHENGAFKMIKLAPGATYPVHHHPQKTEFAYILNGKLAAVIGEETHTGEEGAFYRFPVNVKHGLKNPGDEDTVVLIGALQETSRS